MLANRMKSLGPTRDSISFLYESQLSNLAASSLIGSGLSPTSARRDDSTSSKPLVLSNLRRTPVKGISRGVESFMVDRFAFPNFRWMSWLGSEVIAEHRQAALRFGFGRFILDDIPVLGEAAVFDPDNVRGDPGNWRAMS